MYIVWGLPIPAIQRVWFLFVEYYELCAVVNLQLCIVNADIHYPYWHLKILY